jgi:hypothetical protein
VSDMVVVDAPLGFTGVVNRVLLSSANCVVLLYFRNVMKEVDVDSASLVVCLFETVLKGSC